MTEAILEAALAAFGTNALSNLDYPASTPEPRQPAVETIGGFGSVGRASPEVSGSARYGSTAKTPRNSEKLVRGSRSGREFSEVAD